MLNEELKNYDGEIIINGKSYTNENIPNIEDISGDITIQLIPNVICIKNKVRITVQIDMTESGYGMKEFHKKWNNDIPMPYRRMEGYIVNETETMYKVELETHGVSWKGYILKSYIEKMENIDE